MPTMINADFKPLAAGAMRSFCNAIAPSVMTLHRFDIFSKDGRAWVSPPSKQIIERECTVLLWCQRQILL